MSTEELKKKYDAYKNKTAQDSQQQSEQSDDDRKKFYEAVKLTDEERYEEAAKILMSLAEKGDDNAQFNLAIFYEEGSGVKKDMAKALDLYTKAAQQGNIRAQLNVGFFYAEGSVVTKDKEKAIEWWSKAASQGDSMAWENLYKINPDVRNVQAHKLALKRHYKKAVKLFRAAADDGDAHAQYELAYYYTAGEHHISKNMDEAVHLYRQSAEQGYTESMFKLADFYYEGEGVTKDLNTAREWYRRAAIGYYSEAEQKDDWPVKVKLAKCFEINEDYEEAFDWYCKAEKIKLNWSNARYKIGEFYHKGKGVKKDIGEAIKWYEKAHKREAMFELGNIYLKGEGVRKDAAKAIEWYKEAAKLYHEGATQKLEELAKNGNKDAEHSLNELKQKEIQRYWAKIGLSNTGYYSMLGLNTFLSILIGLVITAAIAYAAFQLIPIVPVVIIAVIVFFLAFVSLRWTHKILIVILSIIAAAGIAFSIYTFVTKPNADIVNSRINTEFIYS